MKRSNMESPEKSETKLLVLGGLTIFIFVLSSTRVGYITISDSHSFDLSIIPAILTGMIGGYQVSIPVAIIWGLIEYSNPESHMQIFSVWSSVLIQVLFLTSVSWFYEWFNKKYAFSPWNVYRTIVASIVLKNALLDLLLIYEGVKPVQLWLKRNLLEGILELSICLLSIALIIKHLKQVHINNAKKQTQDEKSQGAILHPRIRLAESDMNYYQDSKSAYALSHKSINHISQRRKI